MNVLCVTFYVLYGKYKYYLLNTYIMYCILYIICTVLDIIDANVFFQ